jgi:glyoxylase-like metal-dependent hydrolase (beta-lactamase superfamily II)
MDETASEQATRSPITMDGAAEAQTAGAKAALTYPCGDKPDPRQPKQVAPGVYWVRMPLPFSGLDHINLWLLEDGDGWTLVDTGIGNESTRRIWSDVFDSTLKGKPITRVICTHMHPDHVGLAGWISRKFGARLWMSRLEYITCRILVADTGREAPQEAVAFYRAVGWDEDVLDRYQVMFGGFGKGVSPLPDSFRRLSDGDVLKIGARNWRIVTGCGHSPDHACLLSEEDKLFISGDQVLPRISSNVSVFPTEPDADPLSDWLWSLQKLRAAIPSDVLTLPAHNEPFLGLHDRLDYLLSGHEKKLDRVEQRLSEGPRRVLDLFVALFGRAIEQDSVGAATGETLAHLNCLIKRGRAKRSIDATGRFLYEATS